MRHFLGTFQLFTDHILFDKIQFSAKGADEIVKYKIKMILQGNIPKVDFKNSKYEDHSFGDSSEGVT